jgi:glycosyltransferase involved in cell wall biosynthesis
LNIFTHNFNPNSNSGPNKFTRQLFAHLIDNDKVNIVNNQQAADVEFCLIQQSASKVKPMLLRLDGIWFNSDQDYNFQNAPIKYAYDNADAVVFQSEFNKILTEKWFGKHKNCYIIRNAPDISYVDSINPEDHLPELILREKREIWSCASSWRPHKRLKENIRYFLEYAPQDAVLHIAGNGAIEHDFAGWSTDQFKRIKYLGELDYPSLISLYKKSSTFIHLSYLDHCPNVVVDAQSAGCKIVCSSSGGTSEIVNNGIVINEDEWDYSPLKLYHPPVMDFDNCVEICSQFNSSISECSKSYYKVMRDLL